MSRIVTVHCALAGCEARIDKTALDPVTLGHELAQAGWGRITVTKFGNRHYDLCPEHMKPAHEFLKNWAWLAQIQKNSALAGSRTRDEVIESQGDGPAPTPLTEDERHG